MFELSMESLSSKYLMWVFILLLVQICGCKGCIEEEKMGLLEFKAFLKLNDEHADFLLPSWIDNNTSECCNWERVICNPTIGRVKKLSLNDIKQQQKWLEDSWYNYKNVKFWLLNVSLFLPFEELHHLNLSANSFDGFIENEGFKGLSSLKKLEILDKSGNEFDKSAIKSLGTITSLKTLAICSMGLDGSFSIRDSKILSIFKKLETLNLNYNKFKNTSLQKLNIFTSLKNLSLGWNHVGEFFSIQELYTLENLVMLDLSGNDLIGMQGFKILPKLKKLEILNLGSNGFNKTSIKQLSGFTSLKTLVVSSNNIEGFFPFEDFASLSNLEILDLSNNPLSGFISSSIILMSHLKSLSLARNHLNGSLQNQGFCQLNKLQELDLSYNLFQGILPPCLNNLTSLRLLDLSSNLFSGNLSSPLLPNLTSLEYIDLSYNQFELDGQLQENVGHMIPNMEFLNLSNNGFEGILPSSIAEMSSLWGLDLSANNFSREVPKQLLAAKDLGILKLSNNKFHGEIFSRDFNLTKLWVLYLDNNQFTGTLSNVVCRSSLLSVLDVSNNYMSGEIPIMGNNHFKGKLPPEISQLQRLKFLDISQNALSGSLPSLKNLLSLKHLHLQGNMFTGLIPKDFLNSSHLLTLDMRDNKLFGSIPNSISTLLELRILLLRGNLFSGFIPNHLCHLTEISLMDLSNNSFSGPIPRCFGHIQFGEMKKEDNVFGQFSKFGDIGISHLVYAGYLVKYFNPPNLVYNEKDEVEFVTKNRRDSYRGGILDFMFGLDLSCNNLTSEIPHELGMLSWIHALNLSHNQLNGSIPKSFSNFSQIESLDISCNKLSGEIPLELVELNFLEVFKVAYNNISGKVPDTKAQFATFDESSYEGNPFLCGDLLKRKCNTSIESPCTPSESFESEVKCFTTSYIMILFGFATILFINPYWRHRWFNFIEECICSCYYFAFDSLSKLSAYLYN
ncbi:hypothetical protein PVL29_011922 [Vitis rotundifolia]|uniref:Leucine-rich repeat-containing N-terminal plant-type domain-containing protein n=1 Tax=Vitis rotundifolia TaxID=103349 RepID=A0AA39DSX0_VITRO|nr:hypothetical protein PVL29_011922 [Vitis rotundifolia]